MDVKQIWKNSVITSPISYVPLFLSFYLLPQNSPANPPFPPQKDLDTSDYLNTLPSTIQNAVNIFDNAIAAKTPATDDFLVIAHDIHQTTAEVLVEHMLKAIKEKGYRAVTVGECLGDAKENWYRVDVGATLGGL